MVLSEVSEGGPLWERWDSYGLVQGLLDGRVNPWGFSQALAWPHTPTKPCVQGQRGDNVCGGQKTFRACFGKGHRGPCMRSLGVQAPRSRRRCSTRSSMCCFDGHVDSIPGMACSTSPTLPSLGFPLPMRQEMTASHYLAFKEKLVPLELRDETMSEPEGPGGVLCGTIGTRMDVGLISLRAAATCPAPLLLRLGISWPGWQFPFPALSTAWHLVALPKQGPAPSHSLSALLLYACSH